MRSYGSAFAVPPWQWGSQLCQHGQAEWGTDHQPVLSVWESPTSRGKSPTGKDNCLTGFRRESNQGQDKSSTGESNCPTNWSNGLIGGGIGPTGQGNAEVRALQAKVRIP